jgi:hypothetical protein
LLGFLVKKLEYSLEFSQRLIEAAKSFIDKDKINNETGRAILYLSLLSCEISLKALLEQAGYTIKELKKRSHDFSGLIKDLCFCDLVGTGISGSKPYTGAELLGEIVDPNIYNGTVGHLLSCKQQGASKYPNEIRYGNSIIHFPSILMLDCASKVYEWARDNIGIIKRRPA